MGYSTNFEGELKFHAELASSQLGALNQYLGEDRRSLGVSDADAYQGGKYGDHWYHIDLELLDDFSGIRWDGSEKTYQLEHIVNWLTWRMKEDGVDFRLKGELLCQGDNIDDRWMLVVDDMGWASRRDIIPTGQEIRCPHCEKHFYLEVDSNA